MSEVSQRVAEILLSTESIQVYQDKPFVFVSGRISPVYIDCRKLLSFPEEREYIVAALAKKATIHTTAAIRITMTFPPSLPAQSPRSQFYAISKNCARKRS